MTILVTGGCGFIGSNFIKHMLAAHPHYRIVNFDKLTYAGNMENLREVEHNPRYNFIKSDICKRDEVEKCVKKFDIDSIINFAAESHVDRSIMGPAVFIETNIAGTNVLLEVARDCNIKRFVQISTDEVYGSLGPTGEFTESTPLHPNSPYSASKASADLLALAYHHTFCLPVSITRSSNNYGPYQFPEKLIPLMMINAVKNQILPVYGDGLNVRDWLYVKDHCTAIDTVFHKGKNGEIYNIGGNNQMENITLVRLLLNKLGKSETLIKFVKDRPGHDKRYALDSTKIYQELGWKPSVPFDEGLVLTIEWYLNNEPWWQRIITGEYQQYYQKLYGNR